MKKIRLVLSLLATLPLLPVLGQTTWKGMDLDRQQTSEQLMGIDSANVFQNPVYSADAEIRKLPPAVKGETSLEKSVSGGCDLDNYQSATKIGINDFPYTSPESGITVNEVNNVATLENHNYSCGGKSFSAADPAWWLRYSTNYIILTFSAPVSNFTVVVNGSNTNERFYFNAATGSVTLSNFCTNYFTATGNELKCTGNNSGSATGTVITVNNPIGSTEYTLTHNGSGNGSRITLLDCFVKGIDCDDPNHELLPLTDPWAAASIGQSGSSVLDPCPKDANQFVINATGYSPNTNNDAIQLTYQTLCDNSSITAHLTGVSGGGWAGVTMRESTATGSKMVALKTQLTNFIRREARSITNGPKSTQQMLKVPPPSWLRIQRSGNIFSYYTSTDGISWSLVGTQTIAMNNCLLVGMFAESINVNTTTTASFDNITVTGSAPVVPLAGTSNPDSDVQESIHLLPAEIVGGTKEGLPTLTLYPNPTNGQLVIGISNAPTTLETVVCTVYNSQGQQILQRNIAVHELAETIDLSSYPNGVYWVRVQGDNFAPSICKVAKADGNRS